MATTITLYASPTGPSASVIVDAQPNNRMSYDIASATHGAALTAINANATPVVKISGTLFVQMLQQDGPRLDRLVSILAVAGAQYHLDDVAYTVRPNNDLDGGVVLTKTLPTGSFTMIPQTIAVPFADILNIKDIPKVTMVNPPPVVFQEHDPEFTADGLPRGMSKYPASLARQFPKSPFWKEVAIHANLSLRPHPFESKNPLVFLDPSLIAGLFSCTADVDVVDAIHAEHCVFFRTNIDADTTSGSHPWYQRTLDILRCALRALHTLVQMDPTGFESYRDQVDVCKYVLSLILRRAGREMQDPGSSVCKTPGWFYKEIKDGEKAKEDRTEKKRLAPEEQPVAKVPKVEGKVTPRSPDPKATPRATPGSVPPILGAPPAGTTHGWWDNKQQKWHYGK